MIASTQTNHPIAAYSQPVRSSSSSPLEIACDRLRNAGLRITQPRVAIINALVGKTVPQSIEQIHGQLDQTTCDLVTVYRCLNAFHKAGLVRLSYFHNGTSLYQLALDESVAAFHIVDRSTQASEPLDASLGEELKQIVRRIEADLKSKGYKDVQAVVNFLGEKAAIESLPSRTEAPSVPPL